MISDETFNTGRFIEFPQTLIKGIGRKIFLIVDNLRLHHTKPVKVWLGQRTKPVGGVFTELQSRIQS